MPTLHAALEDRLLRVERDDGRWRAEETLTGHDVECLAAAGDLVVAGTVEDGLRYSTDGGDGWTGVPVEGRVTAVTVDRGTVWVGTEPSAVYRWAPGEALAACADLTALPSSDRWSFPPRPHTHHVRWVEVDPRDPDRLYVAVEAGAFVRSTDGGDTWQPHPEGARRDTHAVATRPDAPGRVYVAAGDGYAESPDGGDTWRYPTAGLEGGYVWGLAVDPGDPDRVVVSAAQSAREAHRPATARSHVYRRDGGRWERVTDGLPDPRGTVRAVLAAGGPGTFYALTNRGLFHSEDAGRSWATLGVEGVGSVGRGLAVSR